MKHTLATLALGLGFVAGAAVEAGAGDWNNGAGGIKDYSSSAAVPVPAPIPVYEAPTRWDFRADIGYGFAQEPSIAHRGMRLGGEQGENLDAASSWFRGDFDTFVNWGLGVGYIISPSWRVDATLDIRSQGVVSANKQYTFFDNFSGADTIGTLQDRLLFRSDVVLFNAYYDFFRGAAFVPYIGAGLGFSVNELKRTINISQQDGQAWDAKGRSVDVTLAAAATAGVTYNVSERFALDFNYRYLYLGGSEAVLNVGGNNSHLSVGDIHEHQLRVGARLNVY